MVAGSASYVWKVTTTLKNNHKAIGSASSEWEVTHMYSVKQV